MRLIDADELLEHKFISASERMDLSVAYMGGWNDAIDSINENAPTVDAEPIIRCKDCHYAKPFNKIWQLPKSDTLVCTYFTEEVDDNFFCGCAIKKDEVNDD